jgi:cellulose synthase/poly-beta-1,6-N-acetylglucosamine synthase-like glycosyltransferase
MPEQRVLISTLFNEYYNYALRGWLDYASAERDQYPRSDILIVLDNISESVNKDFVELAEANKFLISNIGTIPNEDPTRPNFNAIVKGRNEAFDKATAGDYTKLLFVDADTIPEVKSLERMLDFFEMRRIGNVAMVGGNYHYKNQAVEAGGKPTLIPVGDFPIRTDRTLAKQLRKFGWTDRVRGLGFGFTMIDREIFSNPKYRLNLDFLRPDSKYGTEDYPVCKKVRADGYKLVWVQEIRARHLYFNRDINRIERW